MCYLNIIMTVCSVLIGVLLAGAYAFWDANDLRHQKSYGMDSLQTLREQTRLMENSSVLKIIRATPLLRQLVPDVPRFNAEAPI